ncbi:Bug family tripartite tricarboxylate transporter substrate binding protein [Variovorax guangxiensis]|uniref:Tripartite tricarboxylate transporter substrate binding protein n=1 Tax=Variovorax guangxiensis TaxID=1775474 RepID=A0A502DUH0_9BURK|nr:tripartite tricarboxylate transporter substrate binding protein [Variovorax guangxiensis]RZI64126.1 MAG: tripartite tricarboxylate transporter substrate binding protein [Variovorax sp.]TPG24732.1 tripartite tricarboxylate transporter substrate binding protein [Variovorax ginsengisoli]TPG28983.1 tripartite tricarboxylate transporter substrate binding protein [Variovorax guangxiensis]
MTFTTSRRASFAALVATAWIGFPFATAQAADYPTKPIRFVVPYTAGGTTDLVARTVGQKVSEKLGQPVVIDNRAGAGGNIGMDAVAKAAPDGYTIGFGAISTNALNPHIYKSMAFDPRKDFTAISLLGTSTIVLEVPAASPIKSVADLIAAAKKNPGLPYATAGAGTSMNLAGVMFAQMTGTELTHVAYKGSGPAINDMLGNTIGVMFDNLPASLPHIQAGKLRALAVAGPARSPSLPDVPTIAEAGLKGYALDPWFGVYAPANLPAPIVKALNDAFTEALAMPEVKDKLTQAGFTPRGSSAEALAKLTQSEYQRLGEVAKKAGMTAD